MSKQIAVRLPDELVEFIDELVSSGRFDSRAAVITRQVRRLQRQLRAERDAEVYRTEGDYPDLVGLAEYMSAHPVPLDD
ncbi:MAG: antitoxin [Salinibacterium sp.]|nr:MAG: antitoxin [Salinibacterium sp.]